jgi:hypothetical protein
MPHKWKSGWEPGTRFLAVLSHDGERNFGTVVKVEPWQSQAIQARAGHIVGNFE